MSTYPFLKLVADSKELRTIRLPKQEDMLVCQFEVLAHFSKQWFKRFFIVSLYETTKGLCWWECKHKGASYLVSASNHLDQFLQNRSIQVLDEKIVIFSPLMPHFYTMRFNESNQRYNTFEEAYQSIFSTLEENVCQLKEGCRIKLGNKCKTGLLWLRFVGLTDVDDFFYLPGKRRLKCIDNNIYIKVRNIDREGTHWKIEIEGANKQKAIFIFDDNYDLIEIVGNAIKNQRVIPKPMSLKNFVE